MTEYKPFPSLNNELYVVGYGSYPATLGVLAKYLLTESTTPPAVSITTPSDNATYLAPAKRINLRASASDADGTVSKIEFYNGSKLLHTETAAPYGYVWKNVAVGNYTLTAKATDNSGNVTTSAAVHILIVPNKAPVVSIVKPAKNQSYSAPAFIHFEAAALDTDGRITRVEFYNGSNLLRTEYKYPYTYDWINVSAGTYKVTAVAIDNWGAKTTSGQVIVTVSTQGAIVDNRPYLESKKTILSNVLTLRLSPNPASSIVNISASGLQQNKPATISIISASGIIMKTMRISNAATQLDVLSLKSGVYTIKIVSGDKTLYKQFVKL